MRIIALCLIFISATDLCYATENQDIESGKKKITVEEYFAEYSWQYCSEFRRYWDENSKGEKGFKRLITRLKRHSRYKLGREVDFLEAYKHIRCKSRRWINYKYDLARYPMDNLSDIFAMKNAMMEMVDYFTRTTPVSRRTPGEDREVWRNKETLRKILSCKQKHVWHGNVDFFELLDKEILYRETIWDPEEDPVTTLKEIKHHIEVYNKVTPLYDEEFCKEMNLANPLP